MPSGKPRGLLQRNNPKLEIAIGEMLMFLLLLQLLRRGTGAQHSGHIIQLWNFRAFSRQS